MSRQTLLACAVLAALAACKPAAAPDAAGAATATAPASAPATDANPVAAVARAVLPDAKGEVVAAMRKFAAVRSYHARMEFSAGPRGPMANELDYVAPDRYRMTVAGMGTQLIIGDTMYMDMHGRRMKVPMPPGTVTQWRDPARLAEAEASMTVDDQGSDGVDGQAAHKFLVRNPQSGGAGTTIWVGDAGLPLQIVARNKMGDVTVRYSRFGDPGITIDTPN